MDRNTLFALIAPAVVKETVAPFGDLSIRQLTEPEVKQCRDASSKDNGAFCRRLVVRALLGDDGAPLLTEQDLPALEAGAFGNVDALVGAVLKANRIGQGDDAVKN